MVRSQHVGIHLVQHIFYKEREIVAAAFVSLKGNDKLHDGEIILMPFNGKDKLHDGDHIGNIPFNWKN